MFGAQAVNVWGEPRLSADVDVTIEYTGETSALLAELQRAGIESRMAFDEEFVRRTRVLPLDLVLAGPGIEEDFLNRALMIDIGGARVPVISPEDLLVTKILASRPKDMEDVRGILRERGHELDLHLVRSTLELLERALGESDLLPAFESEVRATLAE